jgi:hypothetical protein
MRGKMQKNIDPECVNDAAFDVHAVAIIDALTRSHDRSLQSPFRPQIRRSLLVALCISDVNNVIFSMFCLPHPAHFDELTFDIHRA